MPEVQYELRLDRHWSSKTFLRDACFTSPTRHFVFSNTSKSAVSTPMVFPSLMTGAE